MKSIELGSIITVILFGGGLLGMLARRVLPENHLSDETKDLITVSMAVIGTLSALVLGLLLSSASSSFGARNQEVMEISADMVRLDRLLRRYGPATDESRVLLRRYVAMKKQDLFPETATGSPNVDNPQTIALLETLQNGLLELKPANNKQQWLQSQALQLAVDVAKTRWALAQQSANAIPIPFLVAMVFWLMILFVSFGLFAPRNPTAIAALLLSAMAVSAAVGLILEMESPLQGIVRVSSAPMHHALQEISR